MLLAAALLALLPCLPLFATSRPFWGSGTDIATLEYPLRAFAHDRLFRGDLPLWNPYQAGGAPFQTGVHDYLSPSFWSAIVLPPFWDMKVGIALHLALAGAGGAYLAIRRVRSAPAAILCGLVYAASGFSISHHFAGHPTMVFTAAYLPWVAGLLDRAIHESSARVLTVGLALGLALLCGHLQMVFIGLLGLAAFFGVEAFCIGPGAAIPARLGRFAAIYAIMIVVAVGVAAVHLLPLAESVQFSQRPSGNRAFAASFAASPWAFMQLICPNLFGNWVNAPCFGSWPFWESLAYLGLLPLVLLVAAPWMLPVRAWVPAAITAVLAGCLALGPATPLFDLYLAVTPKAEAFRAPARFLLLVNLFGALLAAQTLAAVATTGNGIVRRQLRWLWGLPILAAVAWGVIRSQSPLEWATGWNARLSTASAPLRMSPDNWSAAHDLATHDAARSVLFLTLAAAALTLLPRRPSLIGVAAVLLTATDLCTFGHRFLGTADASRACWPAELNDFLRAEAARQPGLRIIDEPALASPGRGAAVGVSQVGGYDTLLDRRYVRYFNRAYRANPDLYLSYLQVPGLTPLIARLGPALLLSAEPLSDGRTRTTAGFRRWSPVGQIGGVFVYRNPTPQPRAFLTHSAAVLPQSGVAKRLGDARFDLRDALLVEEALPAEFSFGDPGGSVAEESAQIVRYEADEVEIDVTAGAPAALVLSDNWHPGWRASVDGRPAPVVAADAVMRAMPVPAGRHRVRMEFAPRRFTIGAAISGLTLAAWAWAAGRTRRARTEQSRLDWSND